MSIGDKFLIAIMVLQCGAGVSYLVEGNVNKFLFWFGIVLTNWTVLRGMK